MNIECIGRRARSRVAIVRKCQSAIHLLYASVPKYPPYSYNNPGIVLDR
jgi:hypothetical protein